MQRYREQADSTGSAFFSCLILSVVTKFLLRGVKHLYRKSGFYSQSGAEVKNNQDTALCFAVNVSHIRRAVHQVPQHKLCIYNNSISPWGWGLCAEPATEPAQGYQPWIRHAERGTSRVPRCRGKEMNKSASAMFYVPSPQRFDLQFLFSNSFCLAVFWMWHNEKRTPLETLAALGDNL